MSPQFMPKCKWRLEGLLRYLESQVYQIAKGVAMTYGVEQEVKAVGRASTLPVSEGLVKIALEVAKTIPQVKNVQEESRPSASEDRTHFMRRVIEKGGQAVFFLYGTQHPGHHRANFDIQPECMLFGLQMFEKMLSRLNGVEA